MSEFLRTPAWFKKVSISHWKKGKSPVIFKRNWSTNKDLSAKESVADSAELKESKPKSDSRYRSWAIPTPNRSFGIYKIEDIVAR